MTDIQFSPYEVFSPSMNMAIDEYYLKFGTGINVRLYGWTPAAISIGRSQNVEQVVDIPFCAENGIPIVRRSTGGGAVYHKNDITYMVSAPISVLQGNRQPSSENAEEDWHPLPFCRGCEPRRTPKQLETGACLFSFAFRLRNSGPKPQTGWKRPAPGIHPNAPAWFYRLEL